MEKPKVAKPKLELFGESLWQLLFVFVFQTVCLVFLRIVQISFHLILHFTPQVVGGGFPPILVQWTTFTLLLHPFFSTPSVEVVPPFSFPSVEWVFLSTSVLRFFTSPFCRMGNLLPSPKPG